MATDLSQWADRLQGIGDLPAMPDSMIRVMRCLADPNASAGDLEKIIRVDEVLSLAVLRAANSAALNSDSSRTFNLHESVARLGGRRLQQIVVSVQAGQMLAERGQGYGLERNELWFGSLAGAVGAEYIAKETGLEDPSTCFTAGLLRDVGKIAMEQLFPIEDLRATFAPEFENEPQYRVERRLLGADHAEIGAALAAAWNLPERLQHAIRWHHEPEADPDGGRDALLDIVHAADMVCVSLGYGVGADGLNYNFCPQTKARLRLDRERLEHWMVEVSALMRKTLAELCGDEDVEEGGDQP